MDYFSSNLRRPCWQFFVGQLGWPPAIPPCVPGKGWSPQRLIWTGWVREGLDVGQTWRTSENGVLLMRWWGFVRWTDQGPVYLECTYKVLSSIMIGMSDRGSIMIRMSGRGSVMINICTMNRCDSLHSSFRLKSLKVSWFSGTCAGRGSMGELDTTSTRIQILEKSNF